MSSTTDAPRRPGRPAVGVRIPVRLPAELLDDIDRRARVLGRSRAAVIRSLLVEALGQGDEPKDGVDRSQIRRRLALSPRERVDHMHAVATQHERIRGTARRPAQ